MSSRDLQNANLVLDRLMLGAGIQSDAALARTLGVSPSTIGTWRLRNTLNYPAVIAFCEDQGLSLDSIFSAREHEPPSSLAPLHVPVVGQIAAGSLVSQYAVEHAEEFAPLDPIGLGATGDQLFGLRVEGQSMEPWMVEGDIAICSAFQTPSVGDDVVFYQYATGESTIKRLDALNAKSRKLRLRPINPLFEPFIVDWTREDQLKRVLAVWRDYHIIQRRPSGLHV